MDRRAVLGMIGGTVAGLGIGGVRAQAASSGWEYTALGNWDIADICTNATKMSRADGWQLFDVMQMSDRRGDNTLSGVLRRPVGGTAEGWQIMEYSFEANHPDLLALMAKITKEYASAGYSVLKVWNTQIASNTPWYHVIVQRPRP